MLIKYHAPENTLIRKIHYLLKIPKTCGQYLSSQKPQLFMCIVTFTPLFTFWNSKDIILHIKMVMMTNLLMYSNIFLQNIRKVYIH